MQHEEAEEATDYMTMGLSLGIFMMATILEGGVAQKMSQEQFQRCKDFASAQLEAITGMPSEDAALKLENALGDTRDELRKKMGLDQQ